MRPTAQATGSWQLDVADDVDLPGWVWLPEDFQGLREAWVDEVTPVILDLIGDSEADQGASAAAEVRAVLESALDTRAESSSYAMYLVWPVHAPAAVMCHVNRARVKDLPGWDELDGVTHAVDAEHIGPGLLVSSRFTADTDQGAAELAAVLLVFADEEDAVVVNLEPSLPQLIAQSMVGLGMLVDALAVTRADGSPFQSLPIAPTSNLEEWPTDSEGAS